MVALMIALSVLPARAAPQESREARPREALHRLVTGGQTSIQPGFVVGRVVVSEPDACDARVGQGGREILVVAKAIGRAVLSVWDENGERRPDLEIEVVSPEFAERLDRLDPLLAAYPGVRARTLGTRVAVTGAVASEAELQAVKAIATAAGDIVVLVSVNPSAQAARVAAPPPSAPRAQPAPPPPAPSGQPAAPPSAVPAGAVTPVPLTTAPEAARAAPAPPPTPPAETTVPVAQPQPSPTTQPAAPPASAPADPTPPPAVPVRPVDDTPPPVAPPATVAAPAATARPIVPAPASTPVDYVIELMQFTASTPPLAFLDPKGTSLIRLRLSTTNTTAVNQAIATGSAASPGAASTPGSLHISLEPLVDTEGVVHTTMVVHTDLPIQPNATTSAGQARWVRAEVKFSSRAGETWAIAEESMAAVATGAGAVAPSRPEESADAGGLAGLFGGTRGEQRLVVLVTPFLTTSAGSPEP